MDYKNKYIKYKTKYLELKDANLYNDQSGGKMESIKILNNNLELPNDPIIFIVGYAGAGKSYLSKKFIDKKYHIISCDEIIREHIID